MQSVVIKATYEDSRGGDSHVIRRFPVGDSPTYSFIHDKLIELFSNLEAGQFNIYWEDSDNDLVLCSSEEEMKEALASVTDNVLRLYITDSNEVGEDINYNAEDMTQDPRCQMMPGRGRRGGRGMKRGGRGCWFRGKPMDRMAAWSSEDDSSPEGTLYGCGGHGMYHRGPPDFWGVMGDQQFGHHHSPRRGRHGCQFRHGCCHNGEQSDSQCCAGAKGRGRYWGRGQGKGQCPRKRGQNQQSQNETEKENAPNGVVTIMEEQ